MTTLDTEKTLPQAAAGNRGFATELAERCAALTHSDLDEDVLHYARFGILDTVGVTLAGRDEDCARIAAKSLELAAGEALILGSQRRVGMLDAALVNGTASHALDFDDCNNTLGGHPSAPVLSALFPLADALGSSGRDLVVAYVAGFEVETKLGLAVNFHHYTKGWHPTATLGVFGAAAASARLMGLDTAKTATALALAASFASGLKANFGTMTKPLHVGHAARNGLYAARLAAAGFTANGATVFEHKQGFLDLFNGPGTYDTARALAAWAAPFDIVEPDIAIKQYPCCGSTHPALDAMLDLVGRHAPRPDDVTRIDAAIHSRRLQHTNRPRPGTGLDAKFSVQYVLSRALLDGRVAVPDFEADAHLEPRVQQMLERVHMTAYDQTGAGGFDAGNHFGGMVRLTLRDGTVLESQVDQPLGRTSSNPLPVERLRAKFSLCAATALQEEHIEAIADELWAIDAAPRVRTLTERIQAATLPSRS